MKTALLIALIAAAAPVAASAQSSQGRASPQPALSPAAAEIARRLAGPPEGQDSAPPAGARTRSAEAEELTRRLNGAPAAQAAPATAAAAPQAVSPARPAPAQTRAPASAPAPAPSAAAAERERPAATATLDARAIAALPFRIDLQGAQLIEGRAGADAKVYSVKRGGATLLMIYAGPSSQFPIYDGEAVNAAGRTTIVVADSGSRTAVEHLFQRPGQTPAEIHVWLMSVQGADRALAERIGQSVDPK